MYLLLSSLFYIYMYASVDMQASAYEGITCTHDVWYTSASNEGSLRGRGFVQLQSPRFGSTGSILSSDRSRNRSFWWNQEPGSFKKDGCWGHDIAAEDRNPSYFHPLQGPTYGNLPGTSRSGLCPLPLGYHGIV